MMAYFRDNKLRRVDVLGNAESIFYALDNDTATTGMNRVLSANMRMLFLESKLNKITVLANPEARFIPPHELKPDDERLKGFRWLAKERPTRRQVLGKQFDDRPKKRPVAKKKPKRAIKSSTKTPAKKAPPKKAPAPPSSAPRPQTTPPVARPASIVAPAKAAVAAPKGRP